MISALRATFGFGIVYLCFMLFVGWTFDLEEGNQLYKLLSFGYFWIPGVIALFYAKKEGFVLPLSIPHVKYILYALGIPMLLFLFSLCFTFVLDVQAGDDTYLLAPTHGLTTKYALIQFLIMSSNLAMLTLFYSLGVHVLLILGEELFWRGYLLEHLRGYNFYLTAAGIGVLSGLFSIPVFFFVDMFYPQQFEYAPFWMILQSVLLSPLLQQLRISSKSVLIPAICHATLFSSANMLTFIMSDPDSLVAGITGITGFLALVLGNGILYSLRSSAKVRAELTSNPAK